MRVGIIQSNFVPWRGYFDFIDSVDLFVFLDDVQYTRRDWRNRNLFKMPHCATVWATVPVRGVSRGQLIQDVLIDYDQNWVAKLSGLLDHNYKRAPFYLEYRDKFLEILNRKYPRLSQLNVALIRWIMQELGINTRTYMSSEFNPIGPKSSKLLDILEKVGATEYLSGLSAKSYLDEDAFKESGIILKYKSYDYPPYPQLFPPFEGRVSVLDLLLNCGPDSINYYKSRTPDILVEK
jgi:hypothetical protein